MFFQTEMGELLMNVVNCFVQKTELSESVTGKSFRLPISCCSACDCNTYLSINWPIFLYKILKYFCQWNSSPHVTV